MKTEKKIFLEKKDDVQFALQALRETPAELVILNIPQESVLGRTIDNFHTLKNKASVFQKEISIESLDDKILEMANAAGLKSLNPLFRRSEKLISDIVLKSKPVPKFKAPRRLETEVEAPPEVKPKIEKRPELPKVFFEPKEPSPKVISFQEPRIIMKRPKSRMRRFVFVAFLVLFVSGVFIFATNVLPKANITITLKKFPTSFNETVWAETSAKEADAGTNIILPAELIAAKKNLTMNFLATGKEEVERKAKGMLTVYNAFSSEPQALVANTRFLSPDGKIFRLTAKATVPGAKIVDNKIVPSKIDVAVTSDKPGEEYNVPASAKWRIPGFQGTPRYEGFYAESVSAMSGGFVGELPTPTENDLEKARTVVTETLKNALTNETNILITSRFKLFDEAKQFRFLTERIDEADEDGNFGFFGEAELKYLVFEEKMLKSVLENKLRSAVPEKKTSVRDFALEYAEPKVDFASGRLEFNASGSIVFTSAIEANKLKAELAGLSEEKLRQTVFFLPGLEKANVSLWPFWVGRVPKNEDRVKIEIN
ncbi:MAG: hypothetical protein UY26_C0002G0031 [Candidatus Jorgensenbacteria bacterium GW2011_GWA1_48_13]|uniref:Baseplate protein J-like domain-containing protein n=2 Tax=Candidatus Joergenseniibacteriota TaxID=1752739 RepID=A0A0G1Z8V4_9BACT|nr:MAG: hypothetical protein UY26_C0002G0031 [Candidatus Jorgensenbacteria bacterium GW2011_GWA1_48_13]KKU99111.1 MAG: hypothetical protein UY32_C0006G0027 [Candidatus Jorgensenbacteria bacterium GW2011_GWC1_48_8]KKW15479.1 MAG: hypothetical protein UY55_C0001G0233 [Candidatus Jorgensenbacteria bacterium GW2011_GWB1_50_10]